MKPLRKSIGRAAAFCCVMAGLVLAPPPVNATLDGQTIGCGISVGWSCVPENSANPGVVGDGHEFNLLLGTTPFFTVDIGGSSVQIALSAEDDLVNQFETVLALNNLNWVDFPGAPITDFSIFLSEPNAPDLSKADVLISQNMLTLQNSMLVSLGPNPTIPNDPPSRWPLGSSATIALDAAHPAPEPNVLLLVALGLVGISTVKQRNGP